MKLGLGIGLGIGSAAASGGAPAFDPATLSLTGWWRASYGVAPWSGTASAGASGSRSLSTFSNDPSVGAAVNGLTPADYNGSTNFLINGSNLSAFIGVTPSAWTAVALINMDALAADGLGYTEATIIADAGGFWSFNVSASGVRCYAFDGGVKTSAYTALSTGAWTMAQVKFASGNLYSGKNAGTWSVGAASGNVSSVSNTMISGRDYGATKFLDGKVLEIMVADSVISDADLASIKSYFNTRYGLSL